ncbi:hypothetical protein NOI24_16300 [Neorhizobium galegae]|uniref:hypothetical protein n=1 Tax=Neorhizobium galegae TaxID=399 RepID=UPI002105B129|nr:hypothetical protein [Neorhizobium galegae]MCQ1772872.1 hypothetical protein [Neorhizobium galegae]MCQ1799181.1 hypothetical protein [Neorhizobium galegae]
MKKIISDVNWLWAATTITILYVISLGWLFGNQRLSSFLFGNDLNEVGDFIAGIFSPLAFIWLVAAVLTQRQELNETRDQFEQNQKVVDEQLKTINSQNALLALQHTQAQESAKQNYRLNLFERRLEIYNRLVGVHDTIEMTWITHISANDVRKIANQSAFIFSSLVENYIGKVADKLDAYIQLEQSIKVPDEYGNIVVSQSKEHEATRVELKEMSERIVSALSVESLREAMWSSMSVSDN